jgi:hypothetical protein
MVVNRPAPLRKKGKKLAKSQVFWRLLETWLVCMRDHEGGVRAGAGPTWIVLGETVRVAAAHRGVSGPPIRTQAAGEMPLLDPGVAARPAGAGSGSRQDAPDSPRRGRRRTCQPVLDGSRSGPVPWAGAKFVPLGRAAAAQDLSRGRQRPAQNATVTP